MTSLLVCAAFEGVQFSFTPWYLEECHSGGVSIYDNYSEVDAFFQDLVVETSAFECNLCGSQLFSHGWRYMGKNGQYGARPRYECRHSHCKAVRKYFGIPCNRWMGGFDEDLGSVEYSQFQQIGEVFEQIETRRRIAISHNKEFKTKSFDIYRKQGEYFFTILSCEMLRQVSRLGKPAMAKYFKESGRKNQPVFYATVGFADFIPPFNHQESPWKSESGWN